MHPEGNKYYWQERLKIVSSNDANQSGYDSIFRHARNVIEDLARAQNANIEDAEVFFSALGADGNAVDVDYYLVDHAKRVPFWLHEADVEQELSGVGPYESNDHLREHLPPLIIRKRPINPNTNDFHPELALKTEYWIHLESYPAHRTVSESAIEELAALLVHSGIGTRDLRRWPAAGRC